MKTNKNNKTNTIITNQQKTKITIKINPNKTANSKKHRKQKTQNKYDVDNFSFHCTCVFM